MRTFSQFHFGALILVVLTCFTLTTHGRPSLAQDTTPTPAATETGNQAFQFQELHMFSKTSGWAVATVPDPNSAPNAQSYQTYVGKFAYILRTQDGGQTWANVTPQPLRAGLSPGGEMGCDCSDNAVAGFFFLDDTHAWTATDDAATGNQVFPGINVWRTSYSGHSWQPSAEGLNEPAVITIDFIDANHGWLMSTGYPTSDNNSSQTAVLYRTTDGGMSWQLIADDGVTPHGDGNGPISAQGGITTSFHTGMVFETAQIGWITTSGSDSSTGALLHTIDGGKTWKKVAMPADFPVYNTRYDCGMSGLQEFAPGSIAFRVFCADGGAFTGRTLLYRTIDDGKTWQSIMLPGIVVTLNMMNSNSGWLIGCDLPANLQDCMDQNDSPLALTLYHTSDGAKSWTKVSQLPNALETKPVVEGVPEGYIDSQFDFIDDQTGWAISPSGDLLATQDGGKTWSTLPSQIGVTSS